MIMNYRFERKNVELTEPAHIKLDWKSSGISCRTEETAPNKAEDVISQLLLQCN